MFDLRFDDPFSIVAGLALAGLLVWTLGGFLLRFLGALLAVGGLATMAAGAGPVMLWTIVLAALMWLAGHWLFALRHGYVKSSLAQLAFDRLSATLRPPGR